MTGRVGAAELPPPRDVTYVFNILSGTPAPVSLFAIDSAALLGVNLSAAFEFQRLFGDGMVRG
jgi:hypothetical protein